jgi:hypothetical protein
MTSITVFCNTASPLRTCKRNVLSWIMVFYDVTPCRYWTNVSWDCEYQTTWCHISRDHDFDTAVGMSRLYTATLLCPTTRTARNLCLFPWRQATHRSPVFQFAMSRDPRVQSIAVNIKFLLTGAETVSLRLADEWSIEETYCSLHAGLVWVKANRRQINSNSCQIK